MKKTPRLLGVLALALSISPLAAQQPGEISYQDVSQLPDGVVGKRIESLIDAVNSNNPDRVRDFIQTECTERFQNIAPMERHLEVFQGVFHETGGLDFHSIRTYLPDRPGETVVILRDRLYGGWHGVTLGFEETQPRRIAGIGFSAARTPTNVSEAPVDPDDLPPQISEIVEQACRRDSFSGAVLVAKMGSVIFEKACGQASKRFSVPNNLDTKFNLGSMNKMFTAVAVARLVEKGLVSYDDPISKYVDESWLTPEYAQKISVRHLLSHTSGLGSYFSKDYWKGSRELYRNLHDFKPLVAGDKPEFEPGEKFRYSNTGMLLAGVVIESVSGKSYFEFIRENVYGPAGMENSDSYEMDEPVPNLAIGYIRDAASSTGWRNNLFKHVIKGGPAGGGFSTVRDLHRFALALLEGKLVSQNSIEAMWTDQSESGYGYGFSVDESPAGKVVGHGGGFPGLNGNLDIFVEKGVIVAVLSNYDRAASPLARAIRQRLERIQAGVD